jgi:hypothetical protein
MANAPDLATASPHTRQGDHVATVVQEARRTRNTGDRRRDGAPFVEYRRFTVEEVNAGRARGWVLSAGWFRLHHVPTAWAWFRRVPNEGDRNGRDLHRDG